MKLKNNIFSICLSIFIFVFSILQCNLLVYASEGVYPAGTSKLEKVLTEASTYLVYLATRVEAIVDGDFAKWVQNREDFKQWWNTGHISYDEKTDSVLFDENLVNYIKQALKEYAEETNGYIIVPSVHFSTLSTSTFRTSYQYQTVKALVNEYGLIGISSYGNGNIIIKDVSEYLNNKAGFYILSNYTNYYNAAYEDFLTWSRINYANDAVSIQTSCEKVIHKWDEAKSSASSTDGLYYYSSTDKLSAYDYIIISKKGNFMSNSNTELISKDGRNILVFKSKEALESYSVGHRTVYFGSKFYEDTGSVTGSWDDFQDWLDGKYDDFFDKLKDLLPEGSNISEDELEKLIDKLLDQLEEVTDKIEDGNKETNNLLQKILDALNKLDATVASTLSGSGSDMSGIEGYLARILDDLDYMVYKMEESSEEEFQKKTDDMLDEVGMTFSDLGEIAKTKFPLSIPWDIDALLGFLSGKNSPSSEAVALDSFEPDGFIIIDTSHNDEISLFTAESGDGDDEGHGGGGGSDHTSPDADERLSVYIAGVLSSSGAFMSSDGDPVFALPFLISKSLDIKGTVYIRMSKFKFVSQLGRTLFTCIFAMYLIRLTFNVVSLGKDVFE